MFRLRITGKADDQALAAHAFDNPRLSRHEKEPRRICSESQTAYNETVKLEHKADLTAKIMAEIIRAITRLGGDPKSLPDSPSQDDLVSLLRQSGADCYLIGTVASWKDTMEDEEVLDDMQRLNDGRPYFDRIISSRNDRTE
jgi:hypothetical protein